MRFRDQRPFPFPPKKFLRKSSIIKESLSGPLICYHECADVLVRHEELFQADVALLLFLQHTLSTFFSAHLWYQRNEMFLNVITFSTSWGSVSRVRHLLIKLALGSLTRSFKLRSSLQLNFINLVARKLRNISTLPISCVYTAPRVGINNKQEDGFRFIVEVFSGPLCRGTCTCINFNRKQTLN